MSPSCVGEHGASCDDMVSCLQGFPALAVVRVVGARLVARVVFTGESVACKEAHAGGEDRSGETS